MGEQAQWALLAVSAYIIIAPSILEPVASRKGPCQHGAGIEQIIKTKAVRSHSLMDPPCLLSDAHLHVSMGSRPRLPGFPPQAGPLAPNLEPTNAHFASRARCWICMLSLESSAVCVGVNMCRSERHEMPSLMSSHPRGMVHLALLLGGACLDEARVPGSA